MPSTACIIQGSAHLGGKPLCVFRTLVLPRIIWSPISQDTDLHVYILFIYVLFSVAVSISDLHNELEGSRGLTWDCKAKFACRDLLKILKDCIGGIICPWPWIWTGKCRNTKHWQTFPCLRNFRLTFILNTTGNVRISVTVWRARMTIVVMLKQEVLRILSAFLWSVAYHARRMRRIIFSSWPVWVYRIFPHLIKGTVFEEKKSSWM